MKLAGKSEYGRLMVNELLPDVSWCRFVTARKSLSCMLYISCLSMAFNLPNCSYSFEGHLNSLFGFWVDTHLKASDFCAWLDYKWIKVTISRGPLSVFLSRGLILSLVSRLLVNQQLLHRCVNSFKDVRANCFCASLLRTQFTSWCHLTSSIKRARCWRNVEIYSASGHFNIYALVYLS